MNPKSLLKWIIPLFLVLLGIFFYTAVHGHSFLGLICLCLACVISAYYLIALLKCRHLTTAKVLNLILTGILCVGILIFGITEMIILDASRGEPEEHCEYIVVLGAKVNGTAPSVSLRDRIYAARDYLTWHPEVTAILSGGQGPDEGISEAACMYRELIALGIPESQLWLEEEATSTWENLTFSLNLIESKTGSRPEKLGILSSEYHLFRASLFAKDCGVDAVGIPAATSMPTIRLNYFLREVAGVWHYIILGGQYHD